jgi:hypothetical protein
VIAVSAVAIVVLVLVMVGRRRATVGESILLASGAGLLYGLQDAATRAALQVVDKHGIVLLWISPWFYVIVGAAVVGILLSQSAFRAARLDYSLPPIAVAEPVAGIALGVSLLGDVISFSIPGLAVEAVCLAAMIAGALLIGRSATLAGPAVRGHVAHVRRRPVRATSHVAAGKPRVEPPSA